LTEDSYNVSANCGFITVLKVSYCCTVVVFILCAYSVFCFFFYVWQPLNEQYSRWTTAISPAEEFTLISTMKNRLAVETCRDDKKHTHKYYYVDSSDRKDCWSDSAAVKWSCSQTGLVDSFALVLLSHIRQGVASGAREWYFFIGMAVSSLLFPPLPLLSLPSQSFRSSYPIPPSHLFLPISLTISYIFYLSSLSFRSRPLKSSRGLEAL